jgi:gamma-glutamyl-gamma-aminobutyrate hydrolase PuuD
MRDKVATGRGCAFSRRPDLPHQPDAADKDRHTPRPHRNRTRPIGYIIHMARIGERVRIGMVADTREASFGAWSGVSLSAVWSHYVDALSAGGGAPVIFPVVELYASDPALALDLVDGLLLTGGRDLDAGTYGAEPNPENEPADPLRDRVELALARLAVERELPILGVCRGMHVLNVALGGGIDQHLADPERVHRAQPGTFTSHAVETVAGSRLEAILGAGETTVRSHHHQGVEPLAPALRASAHSPDGLVEAAETAGDPYCVAVLWHPEEDLPGGGQRIYDSLVAAAGARRDARIAA